jgi:hypothetical protein
MSSLDGVLHTDNFFFMIDNRGKMYRCGPTPSSGDCTLFNELASKKLVRHGNYYFNGGGPMAVLNSSHIIATSANDMV